MEDWEVEERFAEIEQNFGETHISEQVRLAAADPHMLAAARYMLHGDETLLGGTDDYLSLVNQIGGKYKLTSEEVDLAIGLSEEWMLYGVPDGEA